jgi:hypothetical protein
VKNISLPDGLCHHWVGTVLIPGVTLDRVKTLMQSYDKYQQIYRPAVRQSRTMSRDGDHFTVYLQLFMKKVVSVVLNTNNDVNYVTKAPKQVQVRSATTRLATPREELPRPRRRLSLALQQLLRARGARRSVSASRCR